MGSLYWDHIGLSGPCTGTKIHQIKDSPKIHSRTPLRVGQQKPGPSAARNFYVVIDIGIAYSLVRQGLVANVVERLVKVVRRMRKATFLLPLRRSPVIMVTAIAFGFTQRRGRVCLAVIWPAARNGMPNFPSPPMSSLDTSAVFSRCCRLELKGDLFFGIGVILTWIFIDLGVGVHGEVVWVPPIGCPAKA